MTAALSLCTRELKRFIRQPNRVIGALATPVIFWLLIGAGVGKSFSGPEAAGGHYLAYFYPGALLMILLFTSIFSTISIIEDRREGFLQSVLVAPVHRRAIVLGKVLGGTRLATGQGILFLLLAPLAGVKLTITSALGCAAMMLLAGFALTALGFCIAWRMNSTQGFHAIMNLFLMPMWFLSGALFPPEGAWKPIQRVIYANPLFYSLTGLRTLLFPPEAPFVGPPLWFCFAITASAGLAFWGLGSFVARSTSQGDLH